MRHVALIFVALAGIACATGPKPEQFVLAPTVEIMSAGLVIEAADAAFRIVPGASIPAPFWSYDCPARPTTDNAALAKRLGARPVVVKKKGAAIAHGLLALCPIAPGADQAMLRSYRLLIPEERLATVARGGSSFVAQPSGTSKPYDDGDVELPAWILWLAPEPF